MVKLEKSQVRNYYRTIILFITQNTSGRVSCPGDDISFYRFTGSRGVRGESFRRSRRPTREDTPGKDAAVQSVLTPCDTSNNRLDDEHDRIRGGDRPKSWRETAARARDEVKIASGLSEITTRVIDCARSSVIAGSRLIYCAAVAFCYLFSFSRARVGDHNHWVPVKYY